MCGLHIQARQEGNTRASLCLQWASNLITFWRKTVDSTKKHAVRQKKAQYLKTKPSEDDIGLKGV